METTDRIKTTGFDFVMFLVDDMKRARGFYEALFDIKTADFDSENFVEYDLGGGHTFAIAHYEGAPRQALGGAMFAVPDADAAVKRAEALGAKVLGRFGSENVCTSGWLEDLDGNQFGVHQKLR